MAKKIFWRAPTDTTVTKVEISTSANKYGSYTVATSIVATASGTWATAYTDQTGNFSTWYKIRFYDGTNYSDYSDPITGEQEVNLCSVGDVKEVVDTIGRWTDDEITDAISEVEDLMYVEMGTPIQEAYSPIESVNSILQDTYFVGEENIYRVDRVFYGTYTKHEYFLDDGYKTNLQYGMIKLLPVASGGPTLNQACDVNVRYVPRIYNRVAVYRAAKFLLETVDYSISGVVSKELGIIDKKLEAVEQKLANQLGVMFSSQYANYDSTYGVNKKKITQDFDKNKYISSYGWT